ncbi:hypothetical protein [Burkholderia territorii]|uniref:hypothetical protein n=1 Tax=Burkholderia territorii TaxID=1503055 RepID=UPI000AE8713E|nr:hypothetical protein [Burkholderia territorii]
MQVGRARILFVDTVQAIVAGFSLLGRFSYAARINLMTILIERCVSAVSEFNAGSHTRASFQFHQQFERKGENT